MKKNIGKALIIFITFGLSYSLSAQSGKYEVSEKQIFASMDKTAGTFLEESGAGSFSIGIVKDGKTYTRHYGETDKGKGNKATDNTLFEVASITKLFTGTLMAKAVLDGRISVDDDIRKYITGSYPDLEYHGTPITIKDLVSLKAGFNKDLPDRSEIMKDKNERTPFILKAFEESYTKEQFFKDLGLIRLDTLPGKVYKYNNGTIQLAAHILENVYRKSYETLLKEQILSPLNLKNTKLHLNKNETLANGYDENNVLMPTLPNTLWGASGSLKSTLGDLTRLLSFELDRKNPVVQESQRDLLNDVNYWNGYFWDEVTTNHNGLNSRKHGGAFGTQNLFWVFPDYKTGISVIVNQSGEHTYEHLYYAVQALIDDLKPFGKKSIRRAIQQKSIENVDAGISYYKDLKANQPDAYNFSDESELNVLGYQLLRMGRTAASVKIFRLYVSEFPASGNAYDSLGEAYFNNKEYDLSRQNYLKSLELNPDNTNAKDMLKKIGELVKK